MKTFKNALHTKRNYNCTQVVFCQAENAPGENWIECDEQEIGTMNCRQLYLQAGVRYFGYM